MIERTNELITVWTKKSRCDLVNECNRLRGWRKISVVRRCSRSYRHKIDVTFHWSRLEQTASFNLIVFTRTATLFRRVEPVAAMSRYNNHTDNKRPRASQHNRSRERTVVRHARMNATRGRTAPAQQTRSVEDSSSSGQTNSYFGYANEWLASVRATAQWIHITREHEYPTRSPTTSLGVFLFTCR